MVEEIKGNECKRYKDDLPLPTNGDYIDGSFKLNFEEDGEESLINAQSFAKYDATFKNPKAEEVKIMWVRNRYTGPGGGLYTGPGGGMYTGPNGGAYTGPGGGLYAGPGGGMYTGPDGGLYNGPGGGLYTGPGGGLYKGPGGGLYTGPDDNPYILNWPPRDELLRYLAENGYARTVQLMLNAGF